VSIARGSASQNDNTQRERIKLEIDAPAVVVFGAVDQRGVFFAPCGRDKDKLGVTYERLSKAGASPVARLKKSAAVRAQRGVAPITLAAMTVKPAAE